MSQEDKNLNKYRQFGEIPNYGEEAFIVIPNRVTPDELHSITSLISKSGTKNLLLVDKNSSILEELFAGDNKQEILTFDFQEGSSEKLKSTLAPHISEKTAIVFVPSRYIVQKGANLHFPSEQIEIILGIGTPVVPLFIENLSETQLSIEDNNCLLYTSPSPRD